MPNTKLFIRLLLKNIFHVSDGELLKKRVINFWDKVFYRKKYNAVDIVEIMKEMGMKEGTVVFVHSSMMSFFNYTDKPEHLIEEIIKVIGHKGLLAMPCYAKNKDEIIERCYEKSSADYSSQIIHFDVNKTPTGAGYLAEVFRKYPGVERSIDIQHSVAAIGESAKELLSSHVNSVTCWDESSPYFKLAKLDAIIFSIGLPYFLATVIHCTESVLKDKYPYFKQFFLKKITYNYKDVNGQVGNHTMYTSNIERRFNKKPIINKYFSKDFVRRKRISNLLIYSVNANQLLNRFIELAENGIVMFTVPSTKGFKFKEKNEIKKSI